MSDMINYYLATIVLLASIACENPETGKDAQIALPKIFDQFYNIEDIYVEGDFVVIATKDLPDHGSPFYPGNNSSYEAYDGNNPDFSTAINFRGRVADPILTEQDITLRIPLNPEKASYHRPTSLGPIGIALNGVVLFNQYNGANQLLDDLEFNNIDQYNGHPTPAMGNGGGTYHYHLEPTWLTGRKGADALIGFLLDGFPVYGPEENGVRLTPVDLDAFNGHFSATPEYPDGIYHYHFTDEAPWLNGDGYWGTPGTVSF